MTLIHQHAFIKPASRTLSGNSSNSSMSVLWPRVPATGRRTSSAIVISRTPAPRWRWTTVPTPFLTIGKFHSDSTPTEGSGKRYWHRLAFPWTEENLQNQERGKRHSQQGEKHSYVYTIIKACTIESLKSKLQHDIQTVWPLLKACHAMKAGREGTEESPWWVLPLYSNTILNLTTAHQEVQFTSHLGIKF